jgi:biofilm PGA synthesis N-glycosyltransferase PgaC
MEYLAIGGLILLLYSYIGFPLLVSILATLRPRSWRIDETYRPTVSIILPAFNEELVLTRCVTSLQSLNYPSDRIEILIGSDGSTDRTNAIMEALVNEDPRIRPFYFRQQRGKMLTLNDLVANAHNDILLFVDADVTLNPNAILHHVRHYGDAQIGGVAGRLVLASERNDGVFRSESTFLTIESNLRRNEALLDSTIGLYGGNYSMRRDLWKPLPNDRVYDDFSSVLTIVESGKRLLYEQDAISTELYGRDLRDEFKRKSRNASRCLYTLTFHPSALWTGTAAWLLWPHKILRWTTGFIATVIVAASIFGFLEGGMWARFLVEAEIASVALIAFGYIASLRDVSWPVASQLYWFFNMNLAFMRGVLEFLFNRHTAIWSQTKRVANPESILLDEKEAVHS